MGRGERERERENSNAQGWRWGKNKDTQQWPFMLQVKVVSHIPHLALHTSPSLLASEAYIRTNDINSAVSGEALAVHKKVLGLYVPEDNVLRVDILEACNELNGGHTHRLEGESAPAHVKEIF